MTFPIGQKQTISLLILFLFSTCVFSAEGHIYLGSTLNASWGEVSKNHPKIKYYAGNLTDAYPIQGSPTTTILMSGNSGYEFAGSDYIPAIALGLGLYGSINEYEFTGQLIETATGGSPETLYDFKYDVNSIRLMAETQLTWLCHSFTPFINVGIGPAWNRMTGYEESPATSDGYVALPPFEMHTNTNFAYHLGLGVGYAFNYELFKSDYPHERISLGYRYVNLGDATFETRGQDYPHALDTGQLTANELYLSYTHLF